MTLPAQGETAGLQDLKAHAQQLVAEARKLQKEGRLIEARQKGMEAEALRAPFSPEEDSPELLLQQLAGQARQRIDSLLSQAGEEASYGKGATVEHFGRAEQMVQEARRLAGAFGQDMQPVERRQQLLTELRAKAEQPGTATASNGTLPSQPQGPGEKLLADARRELRSGNTANARKAAIEASDEKYGVREQALALLRSLDAEDMHQRALEAERGFDAAVAAYNRREYPHAASILAVVDPRLLDSERRDRLKNIVNTPEMIGAMRSPITQVNGLASADSGAKSDVQGMPNPNVNSLPPSPVPVPGADPSGIARSTDQRPPTLIESKLAMREVKFQQLRKQSLEAQKEATEKFRVGQTEEAIQGLKNFLTVLSEEELDPVKSNMLRRSVETRLKQFEMLKEQADFLKDQNSVKSKKADKINSIESMEQAKQKTIADLMQQYNTLYKQGKYVEAQQVGQKVLELDPESSLGTAAVLMAKRQKAVTDMNKLKESRADFNLETLNDSEVPPPANISKDTIHLDGSRQDRINKRGMQTITSGRKTSGDREIEHRLNTPVNLNFTETPLSTVLDDIRHFYGINIWVDKSALEDEGINIDQRVTVKLEQISLKSAMTLLLKGSRLTWVVKDEVLQVTSENRARGGLTMTSYLVADLVIPVEDFGPPNTSQVANAGYNGIISAPPSPVEQTINLAGGTPVGTPTPASNAYGSSLGYGQGSVTRQNAKHTQERQLIDLITSTISPRSWAEMGGPGQIDYHPLTMALVVNQSPDIQEQVSDLLAALRRLQDQEVAVEVKVVSVSDDFYEVMGVNFNLTLPSNSSGLATAVANGFQPSKLIAGITPAGSLTSDLSIPITNQSFQNAFLPFFSGPQAAFPGLGGVQTGIAFLSQIQVYLFMEAAQSDVRTNVMQAPKITLFNGQTATMSVQETAPYVANVSVINQNGQVIFQPTIQPLNTGVQLQLQAVISADRRFVRMSIQPTFSNIAVPGPPNLFPVVVPVFPQIGLPGQPPQPIIFTQYLQQQAVESITVGTTVAVPDGGTVVMGGLKTVSESRNEYGPPILSNIPYIDRLFKNVAYGRESSSLLIMVTPRIIIMEEEEFYATGFVKPVNQE